MAVAAAELPGAVPPRAEPAPRRHPRPPRTSGIERITFYVALTVALYVFAGDVIVGALLQRGEFDRRRHPARLVRARRLLARAARHHALPPAPERPLRPRPPQAGGAHRGAPRRAGRRSSAPSSCSRSTGSPSSRSDRPRSGRPRLPARSPTRCGCSRAARRASAIVGLALGAAAVVLGRVPPAARARSSGGSGRSRRVGHDTRWCAHRRRRRAASWPPASGPPPTTCPALVAAGRRGACPPASCTSLITATMRVPEATRARRTALRRLLPG